MNINKLLNLLIFVLIISSTLVACKQKEDTTDSLSLSQEKIDKAVDSTRIAVEAQIGKPIPNLNIFIQTPDGSWFSSSAGVGYQKITADTYFRFASNTKNFTSTAVLNMQEDGWLHLDDKISDTIPGSTIPYVPNTAAWNIPNKNQITIKMLLQHSAGVYDVDNDSVPGCGGTSYTEYTQTLDPGHQFNTEEMVEQLTIHTLSYFLPGTGYHYSNTGYAIIGEIVSRVYSFHFGSQKHLSDYLYDYIYGSGNPVPLDLHFPYLATDTDLPSPSSCGHILRDVNNAEEVCSFNMSAQVAEGNGYSTMRNLNTYIRTLMKGENMLSPASIEMMKNEVSTANPTYALGCTFKENLGYGHNGARIGNLSLMVYDPEYDISIVSYISAFDLDNFMATFYAIYDVAYATRATLGYPGKP